MLQVKEDKSRTGCISFDKCIMIFILVLNLKFIWQFGISYRSYQINALGFKFNKNIPCNICLFIVHAKFPILQYYKNFGL